MKDIIINGRFLTQNITGVQRYAHELLWALDNLCDEGKIDLTQYSIQIAVPPNTQNIPVYQWLKVQPIGRLKNNLWEQISLPLYARNKILFSPCNISPIFGGDNQLVTIHDASVFGYPKSYKRMFLLKYKFILKIMGRFARVIFTDSDFSKKELTRYCGIPAEKIKVVPLGHEHIHKLAANPEILINNNLGHRPFLFTVGSQNCHKNFQGVLLAINQIKNPNFDFVIAGGEYSSVFRSAILNPDPSHVNLGYVNDQELRALYENAACFIFVSFYEGFGLPPLEAMACDCPVIVSDIPSLREVCGDAAVYCDPNNPLDIAEKIQHVLHNKPLTQEMKSNGREQALKFCWKNTAFEIWSKITTLGKEE